MIIATVLSSSTAHAAVMPTCDKSLWQHVFLPTRLHIVNSCISATGVIKSIHVENDGDFHIKLLADNSSLINQANIKFENGDLVLEAICQNTVSRSEVGYQSYYQVRALGKFQLNLIATRRTKITTRIDGSVARFTLIPITNRTKKMTTPTKLAEA